ncbi:MAG: phospho-sugar mutase [Frankiaceae bacterium]
MKARLRALAEDWLADDPDPDARAELRALLDAAAADDAAAGELADRFAGPLAFGTAGLRGEVAAGPNRMNRAVVSRAAAGLGAYLTARGGGRVVVGYDARHKSDAFARDTAEVMSGAGLAVLVMPRPLPTPVLAFAIRHLGCAAGVMVTASHNPPRDNGYKVYLDDGAQITPPADAEIAAAIDAVGRVGDLPRSDGWTTLDDGILDDYLDAVTALSLVPARDVSIAYTPLHGVGGAVAVEALRRAGFPAPAVVAEQAEPDPDFPTVAFPNPEEPGAMDLALARGRASGADVVIANDPDADRCAVAVDGRLLRGDEVGALLADHVLRRTSGDDRLVVTTVVSSTMLRRIAAAHGAHYAETLTGFKWIMRAPDAHPGTRLVLGYEEALGYCIGAVHPDRPLPVRDKDGISAALAVAELVADLRRDGRTLLDRLDELAREHGVHGTDQWSVRVADLRLISDAMAALRADPPERLGGLPVTRTVDLLEPGNGSGLPASDVLTYWLGADEEARVVVRPSGTEPKLKAYLEVVVPVTASLPAARAAASERLAAITADLAAITGL